MKRTYLTLIIMMLVIGFASVATNLVINGTINFGFNEDDFFSNVVFTYTDTTNGEAEIIDNGKSITFKITKLEDIEEKSILDFDIANKSKQYDARVSIKCGLEEEYIGYSDYIDISQDLGKESFELESGETKSGRLTITLNKTYNELLENIDMLCTIIAVPGERTIEGKYEPLKHKYKEKLLNGADPVLDEEGELVPVIIDDNGIVTKADITKKWYNYENQEWANAVILTEEGKNKNYKDGSIIVESDIESYFVWIPKYRYKLFDMGIYKSATTIIDKSNQAIEIEFGLEDTIDDNISTKEYRQCATPMLVENEKKVQGISGASGNCDVGEWMTHPAFISFEVNGLWVGKFETSQKGNTTIPQIKPNVSSWRTSIGVGFNSSRSYRMTLLSHTMKNTEWGAAAYLTQSIYGRCNGATCTKVAQNKNSNYITGMVDATTAYPKSKDASTTGNITGIFDMSGGVYEQVMGAVKNQNNDTPIWDETGLSSIDDKRYYDLYQYSTDFVRYDRRILGDATGELGPFQVSGTNYISSYFNAAAYFPEAPDPWFYRDGSYNQWAAGLFSFSTGSGYSRNNWSGFRIVLAPQ